MALDLPLTGRLNFVIETFDAEESRPDRAVGLRYEIDDGLKVSAAVGRGKIAASPTRVSPGNSDLPALHPEQAGWRAARPSC